MKPNRPSPPLGADNTIDSEVSEELLALPIGNNKPLAWDMDVLVDYITHKIAQEANKARERYMSKHEHSWVLVEFMRPNTSWICICGQLKWVKVKD